MAKKQATTKTKAATSGPQEHDATFTVEGGIVKVTVGGVTVTLNGPAAGCSTTKE